MFPSKDVEVMVLARTYLSTDAMTILQVLNFQENVEKLIRLLPKWDLSICLELVGSGVQAHE
jgi:hypothetical protein